MEQKIILNQRKADVRVLKDRIKNARILNIYICFKGMTLYDKSDIKNQDSNFECGPLPKEICVPTYNQRYFIVNSPTQ